MPKGAQRILNKEQGMMNEEGMFNAQRTMINVQ
jgi:hypothetical protein